MQKYGLNNWIHIINAWNLNLIFDPNDYNSINHTTLKEKTFLGIINQETILNIKLKEPHTYRVVIYENQKQ